MVEKKSFLLVQCNNEVTLEINIGDEEIMFSEEIEIGSTPFWFTFSKEDWKIISAYIDDCINKKED